MKCPKCQADAEFSEAGPYLVRCQNCDSLVNAEDLEQSESD